MNIIQKIIGNHSQNELKRVYPIADAVMALDEDMQRLSDEELKAKTKEFKDRLENGETLDDILPEAYAVVREAASRVLGMKHYRVQIIGGIILHQGRIAEMKTGEGKTLVATLPSYLNALEGKGVHVVTVNDYLAKRDAEWMGQVHEFLGLTVGVVLNSMDNDERRAAYDCDITYVTNNELGFDYLRDNMVIYKEQLVQRGMKFAVIDEVDSVLIDEARTPLIISGQSGKSTKLYEACDILARQMEKGEASGEFSKINAIMGEEIEETGDFIVDEKEKKASQDILWYIWAGPNSPLYGKDKMTTFERYFIADKETHKEKKNAYYHLWEKEEVVNRMLEEFGLDPEEGHIINGHVPVHQLEGENPVKCNGKVIVIDGGFCEAYRNVTGIAGYTLVYSSYGLSLTAHEPFTSAEDAVATERDIVSNRVAVRYNPRRALVGDTDNGKALKERIQELKQLLDAYRKGVIKEKK